MNLSLLTIINMLILSEQNILGFIFSILSILVYLTLSGFIYYFHLRLGIQLLKRLLLHWAIKMKRLNKSPYSSFLTTNSTSKCTRACFIPGVYRAKLPRRSKWKFVASFSISIESDSHIKPAPLTLSAISSSNYRKKNF